MSSIYNNWRYWQNDCGTWQASDGRYSAQGYVLTGYRTEEAIKAKIDKLIASNPARERGHGVAPSGWYRRAR